MQPASSIPVKTRLLIVCFLAFLVASPAQTLVPGSYQGWVTSTHGNDYKLALEVWDDGSVASVLSSLNPITGATVRSFTGEGISKANGIIRGGLHGSGTWRGRVEENRTNATVRVYLRRGFTATFNLQPTPPTLLPPGSGGGYGGVIIVRPPLWPVHPPIVVLPVLPPPQIVPESPIGPPVIAEPPPPPLQPIVFPSPPSGAVMSRER
jgi:hypothetical protein